MPENGYNGSEMNTGAEGFSENTSAGANEEDADFVYGEDENYDYSGSLDSISAENIVLDSMESGIKLEEMRTPKHTTSNNLKLQMMADDLAMDMGGQPQLHEMSDKYGNVKKKEEEILSKDKLDRDEKELIKNRLKAEISSKPEGFNQKKSLEMYHKLMDEQNAKESKRGFLVVLLLAFLGLVTAALTYLSEMDNHADVSEYLVYLPVATGAFSLIMLIRKKAFKIFALVYFIGNTIVLLGPGLIVFALTPENQSGDEFLMKLGIFVAAIACSALISFRLIVSKRVDAYYSYSPSSYSSRRY